MEQGQLNVLLGVFGLVLDPNRAVRNACLGELAGELAALDDAVVPVDAAGCDHQWDRAGAAAICAGAAWFVPDRTSATVSPSGGGASMNTAVSAATRSGSARQRRAHQRNRTLLSIPSNMAKNVSSGLALLVRAQASSVVLPMRITASRRARSG